MLEGENDIEVIETFLLWLAETTAPKVKAGWAQQKQAVSQVRIKTRFSFDSTT